MDDRPNGGSTDIAEAIRNRSPQLTDMKTEEVLYLTRTHPEIYDQIGSGLQDAVKMAQAVRVLENDLSGVDAKLRDTVSNALLEIAVRAARQVR